MFLLGWLLFILPLLALLYTYLWYPALLRLLARRKTEPLEFYAPADPQLPHVTLLCSLYNEEQVVAAKLAGLARLKYPSEKLAFYFGSDASTDQTNAIVSEFANCQPGFRFFPFEKRSGKPSVINQLASQAIAERGAGPDHILIITDANVLLAPKSIYQLVKHFKRETVGLVDAHMQYTGLRGQGISRAEDQYISGEVLLKHHEGLVWGRMIGPFGGCYAIRSDYFSPVPSTFLVDDFYIAMRVFEQGGAAINELEALCEEPVSHLLEEEFRRKKRISAGNFQNLVRFAHLCWPPWSALAFAFLSHKVLRWLGPFLMLSMLLGTAILALMGNITGQLLFFCTGGGTIGIPLLDRVLARKRIDWQLLRKLHYFILMNIALLAGFFKFVSGIRTNIWQPTKRN